MKRLAFAAALLAASIAIPAQGQIEPITWGGGGTSFTGGSVTSEISTPGLTLTKALGTEILTQTCAGWGLAAPVGAWSCAGDTITRTASGANLTITNSAAVVGTTYSATVVTATVTAGTVTASFGADTGAAISTATTTTRDFTATTTGAMTLTASATFAGTITISTTSAKAYTSDLTSSAGPVIVTSPGSLRFFPASGFGIKAFTSLVELENGTTSSELRVYNTKSSDTNYEAMRAYWSGNVLWITADKGSAGGTARTLVIGAEGDAATQFRVNGSQRWFVGISSQSYSMTPGSSNTYDLGQSNALVRTGYVATATEGSNAKSLTDGSATIFAKVAVASGSTWGGEVIYKLEGKDATDFTVIEGKVKFSAINKGGTITCSTPVDSSTASLTSAGTSTLTAFTCADAGSNVLNLLVNYTTSLTDTTNWPKIYHRLDSPDTVTYTPQ